jgi:hypothetical protein
MKIRNNRFLNVSVPTVSHTATFEVFTVLFLKTQVFWGAKLCCSACGSQHSEGSYCLHLQVPTVQEEWTAWPWRLKRLKVPQSFRMSTTTCPVTQSYPRRLESSVSNITTNKCNYMIIWMKISWKMATDLVDNILFYFNNV